MQHDDATRAKPVSMPHIETLFDRDDVLVKHVVLAPGEEVPWHFHNQLCETWYVVRGPLTIFTLEPDAKRILESGATFQTAERQAHRVVNESDREVSALLIQGIGEYDFVPIQ